MHWACRIEHQKPSAFPFHPRTEGVKTKSHFTPVYALALCFASRDGSPSEKAWDVTRTTLSCAVSSSTLVPVHLDRRIVTHVSRNTIDGLFTTPLTFGRETIRVPTQVLARCLSHCRRQRRSVDPSTSHH